MHREESGHKGKSVFYQTGWTRQNTRRVAACIERGFELLFRRRVNVGMRLPVQLNLNSVLVILIGIGCVVGGVVIGLRPYFRLLGAGMFFVGIGNLLFGFTDGFSDPTPTGRFLFRIGAIAYLAGVPILGYAVYNILGS